MRRWLLACVVGAIAVSCGSDPKPGPESPEQRDREPVLGGDGPAGSDPTEPEPDPPEPDPGPAPPLEEVEPVDLQGARMAVVTLDTPLYAEPHRASELIPTDLIPKDRSDPEDRPRAVRVIGEKPDWIEIETLRERAGSKRACYTEHRNLRNLRLRAFVPRSALLPVVVRETEVDLGRRTSVVLSPGLRVWHEGRGRYRIDGELAKPVRLDPEVVGTIYTQAPGLRRHGAVAKRIGPKRSKPIRLGDGTVIPGEETSPISAIQEVRGGVQVTYNQHCYAYRAVLPADQVEKATFGVGVGWGASGDHPGGPVAVKGATAYWRDGSEAGVIREQLPFREDAGTAAGRRCLRKAIVPVKGPSDKTLPEQDFVLCFHPAHVRGDPANAGWRPSEASLADASMATEGYFVVRAMLRRVDGCPDCPKNKICEACYGPTLHVEERGTDVTVKPVSGSSYRGELAPDRWIELVVEATSRKGEVELVRVVRSY